MLWLCLHFPRLPLDVHTRGGNLNSPLAVSAGYGSRQRVLACNAAASDRGVRPGLPVSAAHALAHDLQVRPRDETAEAAALERVAAWAMQFTPAISLQPPDSLLLEVAGSLTLFGGADALLQRVKTGLAELGYGVNAALAPPPAAARLLARAGLEVQVTQTGELGRLYDRVPLRFLDAPAGTLDTLHGMGLRSVSDCLRLPRDGFARRFGPELMGFLDRIRGRSPDPQQPYVPPLRFDARLALPAEVESTEALLFAARRLLLELTGYLQARDCGVQRLELVLLHRSPTPTPVPVGLVEPSRDPQHLLGLMRERLERVQLPEAVRDIQLTAQEIRPLAAQNQTLFADAVKPGEDWTRLVERLRARLGEEAVQGVCLVAEHRPEYAWRGCAPGNTDPHPSSGLRPLWLLRTPAPLAHAADGAPGLEEAPLTLRQGPEIIESGWWDGHDVAREYFLAETPHGARFWVFRERRPPGGWFLHGIFG